MEKARRRTRWGGGVQGPWKMEQEKLGWDLGNRATHDERSSFFPCQDPHGHSSSSPKQNSAKHTHTHTHVRARARTHTHTCAHPTYYHKIHFCRSTSSSPHLNFITHLKVCLLPDYPASPPLCTSLIMLLWLQKP